MRTYLVACLLAVAACGGKTDPAATTPPVDDEPPAVTCARAGCSGQLCVPVDEAEDIVTTCEYQAAYGCYREATCAAQPDGRCGWTPTPALTSCLADPPAEDGDLPQ